MNQNLINALEKRIQEKIDELTKMQKRNVKFQKQQLVKEEIFRLQRQLISARKNDRLL